MAIESSTARLLRLALNFADTAAGEPL